MADGRIATMPYRVRASGVWYWVDPAVPPHEIEPGDTVIVYPVSGDAHVVVLQRRDAGAQTVTFATSEGETFAVASTGIAAMHLAAVDDEQGPV